MKSRYRSGAALLACALLIASCSSTTSSSKSSSPPSAGTGSSTAAAGGGSISLYGTTVAYDASIAAKLPKAIADSKTLKDITYDNAPPDTFVKDGTTVGWEVDLGRAAATVLGLKYDVTTSGAFDTFIPGLQNGRWDVSFSSLIQSTERLKQIDVVTYYTVGTQFASKAGSSLSIVQPTDVCGHTVATLGGSVFVDQLKAIQKLCASAGKAKITIQSYPTAANMALAVANGRAELFTNSANQLAYTLQQTPGQFKASQLNYEPVAEGVGVSKGGLSAVIGAAMDKLIQSGTYAAVMKRWGLNTGLVTKSTIYTS